MSRIVAVTGATGYVGRFVVDELLRRGRAVRALTRPGSDRDGISAYRVAGRRRARRTADRPRDGAESVVHLA